MRWTVAAVAACLALVPGQTMAAGSKSVAVRVSDRVGAQADVSSELAATPLPVLLVCAAVIVGTVMVASDNDSESE